MGTVSLLGLGSYLPPAMLTNDDLSKRVDTNDEWIVSRTGIHSRHVLSETETNTDMGVKAAHKALAEAGLKPGDITHVVYATATPDAACPAAAYTFCHKMGISGIFAIDVNAACSGFLFGLVTARGLIAAEPHAKLLLVAGEALTTRVNWQDRSTCVLFGDGAAAAVLTAQDTSGKAIASLEDIMVSSDGSLGHLLHFGGRPDPLYTVGSPVGEEYFIQMAGREVYKHAVRSMTTISRDLLERNGMTVDDVDLFVPHQANLRIIEAVGSKLGIDPAKVFINVDTCGNTSAASIPVALAEAREKGRLHKGMKVLASTFGGGFSWSAALLRF